MIVKSAGCDEQGKNSSEDDRDNVKVAIQYLTKTYEAQAAELAKSREKEVMEE